VGVDENNQPQINFALNATATDKFARETGEEHRPAARDPPRRHGLLGPGHPEQARLRQPHHGRFTTAEADELSKILKAGALPATLRYLQELTVGASLGRDSIRDGVRASIAAMAFITISCSSTTGSPGSTRWWRSRQPPHRARGARLHQRHPDAPGIAGIILTVGVGVDTNVLVFERIREELRNGKTVRAAVQNGFERSGSRSSTPRDRAHRGGVPLPVRTGPIKGFAVTLVIGLVANVFASYFVSKFISSGCSASATSRA